MTPRLLRPDHGDGFSPADLEAITDRTVELVHNWTDLDNWADNAPASERDTARYAAEEAKDELRQYLSHVWGGAL